jgi:hypothetical protein
MKWAMASWLFNLRKKIVTVIIQLPISPKVRGSLLYLMLSENPTDVEWKTVNGLASLSIPSKQLEKYLRSIILRSHKNLGYLSICKHAIEKFAKRSVPPNETISLLDSAIIEPENENFIRRPAIKMLLELGEPGIKILLQVIFEMDDAKLNKAIIPELPTNALTEIMKKHPKAPERKESAEYLGYSWKVNKDQQALHELINSVKNDNDDIVRATAACSVVKYGEDGITAIKELACDQNSKTRLAIVRGLPIDGFEEILIQLSKDIDIDVRQTAQYKIAEKQRKDEEQNQERQKKDAEVKRKIEQKSRVRSEYPLFKRIESASDVELANFLVEMLDSAWTKGAPSIEMDEAIACRIIGEELSRRDNGSNGLMFRVITKMLGRHNNSRCLDVWWDGIAGWRG